MSWDSTYWAVLVESSTGHVDVHALFEDMCEAERRATRVVAAINRVRGEHGELPMYSVEAARRVRVTSVRLEEQG